jgi:hypothetical protein
VAGSPVVLRIKLRYEDVDTMVQRFAPNVGKSGLFLPTKAVQPVGAEVKFELRLFDDTPVLVGLGRVKHVKPPDQAQPKATYGMAIELMRVSREGRELIIRMIERRRALGLADVAVPGAEDVESARRDADSNPRAETSGIVREAMAQLESAPISEPILTARPASGPLAVAHDPVSRPIPAPRLAPDSGSRPFAPISPLAPEGPRSPRPKVADLIAKASDTGPVEGGGIALGIEGIDEAKVDVGKVIARARILASSAGHGELDAELAALQDASATPVEIGIEAASAELARQLGGAAVARRDRSPSSHWAPPPAVAVPAAIAESAPVTSTAPALDPAASAPAAALDPAASTPPSPVARAASTAASALDPAASTAASALVSAAHRRALELAPDASSEHATPVAVSPDAAGAADLVGRSRDAAEAADLAAGSRGEAAAAGVAAVAAVAAASRTVPRAVTAPAKHADSTPTTDADTASRVAAEVTTLDAAVAAPIENIAAEPAATKVAAAVATQRRPALLVDEGELGADHREAAGDDDEDIEELDSLDLMPDEEPDESTQIGAAPLDPAGFEHQELAARLEEQLAHAEEEADRDFARAMAPPGATSAKRERGVFRDEADADEDQASDAYPDTQFPDPQYAETQFAVTGQRQYANGRDADGRDADGRDADGRDADGRDADGRNADGRDADGRDADGRDLGDRDADGRYLDDRFRNEQFADTGFADVRDADVPEARGRYADIRDSDDRYPDSRHPDSRHPDSRYPDTRYPDTRYPDTRNAGAQYPGEPHPDNQYSDTPRTDAEGEEFAEEISDFDVLAVADEDDADLLRERGDVEGHGPDESGASQPIDDFASRLDLSDEIDTRKLDERRTGDVEDRSYDPPSGLYTVAENYPGQDGLDFDEPHSFHQPRGPQQPPGLQPLRSGDEPRTLQHPHTIRRAPAVEPAQGVPQRDSDLEHALDALDVDLDDIAAAREGSKPVALPGLPAQRPRPEAAAPAQRSRPEAAASPQLTVRGISGGMKQPARPKRVPTENDGVLIDFDDEDD